MSQNISNEVKNFMLSDDELVIHYQITNAADDIELLFLRYKYVIRKLCKSYFLPGADYDDLLQEAYLGFFKAMRDYKADICTSFFPFAMLCMRRQLISALKQATRQKHLPLNQAISLDQPIYDRYNGPKRVIADVLPSSDKYNPEKAYFASETIREINKFFLHEFSDFEAKIMALYLLGYTYREIGISLNVHEKAITNGMYRVQKKLKRIKNIVALE